MAIGRKPPKKHEEPAASTPKERLERLQRYERAGGVPTKHGIRGMGGAASQFRTGVAKELQGTKGKVAGELGLALAGEAVARGAVSAVGKGMSVMRAKRAASAVKDEESARRASEMSRRMNEYDKAQRRASDFGKEADVLNKRAAQRAATAGREAPIPIDRRAEGRVEDILRKTAEHRRRKSDVAEDLESVWTRETKGGRGGR